MKNLDGFYNIEQLSERFRKSKKTIEKVLRWYGVSSVKFIGMTNFYNHKAIHALETYYQVKTTCLGGIK